MSSTHILDDTVFVEVSPVSTSAVIIIDEGRIAWATGAQPTAVTDPGVSFAGRDDIVAASATQSLWAISATSLGAKVTVKED